MGKVLFSTLMQLAVVCAGLSVTSLAVSGSQGRVEQLLYAIDMGQREVVEAILPNLDMGMLYNDRPLGLEILVRAARSNYFFVVIDLLFEDSLYKTDFVRRYVNMQDHELDTPLLIAIKHNHPRAGFYLLAMGDADPNILDKNNQTALDIVLRKKEDNSIIGWVRQEFRRLHRLLRRCDALQGYQLSR